MKRRLSCLILLSLVLMLSLTACQMSKAAKELILEESLLVLDVGETREIRLTILPEDALRPALQWSSSDSTIVSIDPEKGTATGLSAGTATITVTSGNGRLSATTDIEVRPVAVTDLIFHEKEVRLLVGSSGRLRIGVEPSNATDQTLDWISSDAAVASVDSEGMVSARTVGNAVILASTKDGRVSGTVLVEVEPKAVTAIIFRQSSLTMEAGTARSLEASVVPSDATDQTLEWQTDSSKVARVDSLGNVTAMSAGTAVITALTRDGRISQRATVEVTPKTVKSLKMSEEDLSLPSGSTARLKVSFAPSDAAPPVLVWSSSDEKVAAVDQTGKVTGVALGKTTVTARTSDGKLSAAATVSVVQGRVKGITLDRKSLTLMYGGTDKLVATLNPADAANQGIRWDSTNYLVASVDEMGNLQAKAIGTTVITAKSRDGGFVAKATVTVAIKDPRTGELYYGPDKEMLFASQSGGYKTIKLYTSPHQVYPSYPYGESWNVEIFREKGYITINRIDFSFLHQIMDDPVRIIVTVKDTGKVVYDYNPMGWYFPE